MTEEDKKNSSGRGIISISNRDPSVTKLQVDSFSLGQKVLKNGIPSYKPHIYHPSVWWLIW